VTASQRVANIGDRGARRRRRAGVVLCTLAAVALIVLVIVDVPSWWRLLVGVPAGLGAAELLQAREKT
jgi:hypothetical protein